MTCEHFEAFIIDETLRKPDGFDEHVAGCAGCRTLKAGHLRALALDGRSPRLAMRLPMARLTRRAGIVFGLALAVTGSAGLYALDRDEVSAPVRPNELARADERVPLPLEGSLPVVQPSSPTPEEADASWNALIALRDSVALDSSRNPRVDDAAYRAFGSLPQWVAPTTTRPIRSLGRAASPIVYTSED